MTAPMSGRRRPAASWRLDRPWLGLSGLASALLWDLGLAAIPIPRDWRLVVMTRPWRLPPISVQFSDPPRCPRGLRQTSGQSGGLPLPGPAWLGPPAELSGAEF